MPRVRRRERECAIGTSHTHIGNRTQEWEREIVFFSIESNFNPPDCQTHMCVSMALLWTFSYVNRLLFTMDSIKWLSIYLSLSLVLSLVCAFSFAPFSRRLLSTTKFNFPLWKRDRRLQFHTVCHHFVYINAMPSSRSTNAHIYIYKTPSLGLCHFLYYFSIFRWQYCIKWRNTIWTMRNNNITKCENTHTHTGKVKTMLRAQMTSMFTYIYILQI